MTRLEFMRKGDQHPDEKSKGFVNVFFQRNVIYTRARPSHYLRGIHARGAIKSKTKYASQPPKVH